MTPQRIKRPMNRSLSITSPNIVAVVRDRAFGVLVRVGGPKMFIKKSSRDKAMGHFIASCANFEAIVKVQSPQDTPSLLQRSSQINSFFHQTSGLKPDVAGS